MCRIWRIISVRPMVGDVLVARTNTDAYRVSKAIRTENRQFWAKLL